MTCRTRSPGRGSTPSGVTLWTPPCLRSSPSPWSARWWSSPRRAPAGRIVGQVLNMSADESILGEDGLVDADKAHFLSFDRVRRVYRLLGGVVGQAYQDGKRRMK